MVFVWVIIMITVYSNEAGFWLTYSNKNQQQKKSYLLKNFIHMNKYHNNCLIIYQFLIFVNLTTTTKKKKRNFKKKSENRPYF